MNTSGAHSTARYEPHLGEQFCYGNSHCFYHRGTEDTENDTRFELHEASAVAKQSKLNSFLQTTSGGSLLLRCCPLCPLCLCGKVRLP